MKRWSQLLASLICIALLLSACGQQPAESTASEESGAASTAVSSTASADSSASGDFAVKEDKDTIVYGADGEPGLLDPQGNGQLTGMCFEKQVYDPLIDKDPETGEFIPALATAWEWVDDTHLKLELREGVKWHDGSDFTAEDVVFTVGRMEVGAATASLYKAFDAANSEIVDDHTVILAFRYPYAPAINFLTNGRAYIVSKDYVEANGEDCLNQSMMGTGAYKFVEWVIGDHFTCERNDDYWGEKPAIRNVKILFITDNTARMVALETGEIDVAIAIQDADIKSLLNGEKEHLQGALLNGMQVNYFGFNPANEALADKRVRQAIAHAVDWAAAVEAAGGVTYSVADSCVAPTIAYYKSIGTYTYDPDTARALLEEAGYGDGLHLVCVCEEVPAGVRLVEIAQAYLAEIGITLEIQSVDTATREDLNNKGQSDISLMNMTASTGDPAHTLNTTRMGQTGRIDDERYVELFDAGLAAMDETERGEIYAEIQQYVYDEVLQLPIFVKNITYGYWDYLDGFIPTPDQLIDFRIISFR